MDDEPRLSSPPAQRVTTTAGAAPPPPQAQAGWVPGARYRRVRTLGRGAQKHVHLAHDERLDREVAVSVITGVLPGGLARERLVREVQITAQLDDHPHIVTVHDVGEGDGMLWIVAQFVRGGSLAGALADRVEPPAPDEAVAIAIGVADALAFAHDHGVVHRDVKPANILLDGDGSALLADFGVALLTDRVSLTEAGTRVGTVAY